MAKSLINLGTTPNDRTGDTLRDAGSKTNSNFNELYTALGDGTALGIAVTGATSGQVLKFNGTSFVPAADINTDAVASVNGLTGTVSLNSENIAEPANNTALAGVVIAGTAGQFTCTATQLAVGQTVTITGTLGGTGTITDYTTGKVYTISVTNGTTSFTLTDAGAAIVTTAGTPTGLTYTPSTLNRYFTTARARAAISASGSLAYNSTTGALTYTQANTDNVPEGTSNQYYTSGRFDFRLSQKTTSDLAEGSNQYFTNARARAALSGTGGIAYNSTTGVISVSGVTPLTTWTVSSTGSKLNVAGNGFLGNEENPTIYVYRGMKYQFNNTANAVLEFVNQDTGVESVTITNGGSYASTGALPTVSFTGGTGSGATGTVVGSGFINTVTVTAGGSGYTIPPLVTFTGGGTGGAATAVLTTTGAIKSIDVTNAGTSYLTAPTVSFTATTGSDATATAKLTYPVNEITIVDGGSGYTTAPTVVIGGSGTGATATATVSGGVVTAVTVTAGGTGYYLDGTSAPITFTPTNGGTGASATSNYSSTAGQVTQIDVTAGGTGYSSDVAVVLTGGSGSGAAATARRNLSVASITVTNGGTGYTTPTVVITQNTAGGEPGTITDIATATAAVLYAVSSVTITNPGAYTVAPTVAFSSGDAAGTAVLDNILVTAARDFTSATAAATTGSTTLCPLMSTTTGAKWKYRLVGAESTQVGDIVVV